MPGWLKGAGTMDEQKKTYNYYDDWDNVSAIVQFPDMQVFIP